MLAPADAGDILADARKLRQARTGLIGAAKTAAGAGATLDALAALPERLAADRAALARRLSDLEAAIHRERAEGIEVLDDLTRGARAARRLLGEWERLPVAEGAAGPALAALDSGAAALESAATTLTELEARAADLTRERLALDERLRRTAADLDETQAATKAGPGAAEIPEVRPLLRRAAVLLNESAPTHRRRREFDAAGADVAAAARLIALGRDLAATAGAAQLLEERDDGVSLGEAVAGLRRELTEMFDRLGSESVDDASAGAGRAAGMRAGRRRSSDPPSCPIGG
jgi:hypothetical protein